DRVPAMSDPEKEAVRGFAQTIQAFDFLKMINTRDVNGAPIPTGIDLTASPAPIATKAAVFAHIVQLLDEGQRHLQTAVTGSAAKSAQGLSSDLQFLTYNSVDAPIPIIRNEELILLRAEANIGLNTAASLAAAVADLNVIRVRSGNLPVYAGAVTQAALLDELLYNKRYSLMFEGGHRWIDLRRYNRLSTLPQDPTSG